MGFVNTVLVEGWTYFGVKPGSLMAVAISFQGISVSTMNLISCRCREGVQSKGGLPGFERSGSNNWRILPGIGSLFRANILHLRLLKTKQYKQSRRENIKIPKTWHD
jgi:hypothetical protein